MQLVDLKERLAEHEDVVFPEFPEDAEFANWVDELFEVDDYYFGIISAMIEEDQLEPVDKTSFDRLKEQLFRFEDLEDDQRIYSDCQAYLDSLESLLDLLEG